MRDAVQGSTVQMLETSLEAGASERPHSIKDALLGQRKLYIAKMSSLLPFLTESLGQVHKCKMGSNSKPELLMPEGAN